jgi:uncharacterized protein with HEPN domain
VKDDSALLTHILDAILRIEKYIQGGEAIFLSDTMVPDAVIRNF